MEWKPRECLYAETVQTPAGSFERINDIKRSHSLPFSVFSVGYRVPDDVLKEDLKDTTSLLINEARDTLHTTSPCETTNRRLGNALDVVTKNLAMALSTTLAESFSTFSTASHC